MTPIQIAVPESLTSQKAELETTLAAIAGEEAKLAIQRKDIQVALQSISTAVAALSGQPFPASNVATPTGRNPMSPEARQRIAEGLRKSAQAKALAKAALGAGPALQASAPAPADAPMVVSEPQVPAPAPADVPVADPPKKPEKDRKAAKK
jgi:ribonuclease E